MTGFQRSILRRYAASGKIRELEAVADTLQSISNLGRARLSGGRKVAIGSAWSRRLSPRTLSTGSRPSSSATSSGFSLNMVSSHLLTITPWGSTVDGTDAATGRILKKGAAV